MFKKKIIFIFFVLIISVWISVSFLGKKIEKKMSNFVYDEVNKVAKDLIRDVLNEDFFKEIDLENLFVIEKNSLGEIELIDFDVSKVNSILGKVNDKVAFNFKEFDKGNISVIYENSSFFHRYDDSNRSGVVLKIPLGVASSNPIFVSLGPKVPIKIKFSGQVETDIVTSIKQYGINSVLVEIDIEIKVREKIVFPFSSRYVDVDLTMPLVIELVSGKVPENYLNK